MEFPLPLDFVKLKKKFKNKEETKRAYIPGCG